MAAPSSGVTIDIQRSPSNGEGPDTYGNSPNQVSLNKIEDPAGSGFWKYTHTKNGGGPFQVREIKHGKDGKSFTPSQLRFDEIDNIQHLVVWYWEKDDELDTPLMVEVLKDNGTFIYSSNKGGSGNTIEWQPLPGKTTPQRNQLKGKELEQKLDGLNCYLNDAVTLNLTFENSSHLTNGRKSGSYCCIYHNPMGDSGRISVTLLTVRCKKPNHNSAGYFKHTINSGGWKVAAIKYDPTRGITRNRIRPPGLQDSGNGPLTVYVFYCDRNPVLIYVEGGDKVKGWYHKPTSSGSSSNDEEWKEVNELRDITHSDLDRGTLNHDNYNKLIRALREFPGCGGLKTCPQSSPQVQSAVGKPKAVSSRGKDGPPGGNGLIGPTSEPVQEQSEYSGSSRTKTDEDIKTVVERPEKKVPEAKNPNDDSVGGPASEQIINQGVDDQTKDAGNTDRENRGRESQTEEEEKNKENEKDSSPTGTHTQSQDTEDAATSLPSGGSTVPPEPNDLAQEAATPQLQENSNSGLSQPQKAVAQSPVDNHQQSDLQSLSADNQFSRGVPDSDPSGTPQTAPKKPEAQAQRTSGSGPGTPQDSYPSSTSSDSTWTTENTIYTVLSSVIGTSALACFSGWKLYNRYKGDPWVRQT